LTTLLLFIDPLNEATNSSNECVMLLKTRYASVLSDLDSAMKKEADAFKNKLDILAVIQDANMRRMPGGPNDLLDCQFDRIVAKAESDLEIVEVLLTQLAKDVERAEKAVDAVEKNLVLAIGALQEKERA
jgi:hypothetical protein